MKIKLLNPTIPKSWYPTQKTDNAVGADVYATQEHVFAPGETYPMGLGFGLEIPPGFAGFIFPRSSCSKNGIICQLAPIDPYYSGEIHAIITNVSSKEYCVKKGDRIGQLVIVPVIIPEFVENIDTSRGTGAFGSTGK